MTGSHTLPLPLPVARGIDAALEALVVPSFTKLGPAVRRHLPTWPADPRPGALRGKVALVTGASSGLGEATVIGLARLGATVHLVVRDEAKGRRVRDEVFAAVPGASLVVDRCDVSDLDDVRRFVDDLAAEHVDVVVHNAGALPATRTESAQGHEMTMALHVLGPLLMTDLLRPRMAGRDARVVLVTSGGMYPQVLRADDPEYRQGAYSGTTAYARSKRAQVELVPRMADRWRGDGIGVHVMHPGWADTPGVVDSLPAFHTITGPLLRDAAGGADTTVWLAAAEPAPQPGQLWHDRLPRTTHFAGRNKPRPGAVDEMWAWALAAAGLDA